MRYWQALAAAAALGLAAYAILCHRDATTHRPTPQKPADVELYRAIVKRVHTGESYYSAAGDELHARGYATLPVVNWRLPTLAVFQAQLPSPSLGAAVLTTLGVATALLWWRALMFLGPVKAVLVIPCLFSMLPAWINPSSQLFHDAWAGQLIALSLACRANGWLPASLVAGALALSIRELALLYVIAMAGLAVLEARRGETVAWSVLAAVFLLLLNWHYRLVAPHVPADALRNSWGAFGGWCFILATARSNLVLFPLPGWIVAMAVPMLLSGFVVWRSAHGRRLLTTVAVYFTAFAVVGRPDNWYWGLLVAPILPLGAFGWAAAAARERERAQ